MKIAIVNTYSTGSTGTIASLIGNGAIEHGHSVRFFYGREKQNNSNWEYIGENKFSLFCSNLLSFLTGRIGSFHYSSTMRLIKEITKYQPDVIHLHNIHGNYLNFKLLFKFFRRYKGKIVITMHDEFLLTGRCALCFCDKWKKGCYKCQFLNAYPHAFVDRSKMLHKEKIELLKSLQNVEIVTPSKWLESLVEESKINFIKHRCIYNGLSIPTLEEFDLDGIVEKNKINILFSAYTWSVDKGALIIKELSQKLDKSKYNIIIVGYDDYCLNWFDFECKKLGLLTRGKMLFLLKNVDVFVNPTFKDNLPTLLIECLQVNTPAITFNTGGCSEIIDNSNGIVLEHKTADSLFGAIDKIQKMIFDSKSFEIKSKLFSEKKMVNEYMLLYKEFGK